MNIFVTGATGFIGANLVVKLAETGATVHALCRSEQKAKLIEHDRVKIFMGNVLDTESMAEAVFSCKQIYHLGALAVAWTRDEQRFFDVNVLGTRNVLDLAVQYRVKKVVVTSTAGVLGISRDKEMLDERSVRAVDFFHPYESSKYIMEKMVGNYAREGLEVVLVNPSRVYGPGLLSQANSATKMIDLYRRGKWRVVPGDGKTIGNYCFIDDVVRGHLDAMRRGKRGERYILGGINASYEEFFETLAALTGVKRKMLKIPFPLIKGFSRVFMVLNSLFRIPPPIVPSWVKKFSCDTLLSSAKAQRELKYEITPLEEGLRKTLEWLQSAQK